MKPFVIVEVGWLGALLMFWRPLLVVALILSVLFLLSLPLLGQMAAENTAHTATPAPMPIAPVWQTSLALAPTPVPTPGRVP
ncbi:MAG: hypothetical protein M3069_09870 [Chloroflexota bacterium]|nr:hypothetical protein [Chloroflexota bacterium]